jgi:hypothetical protein
MAEHKVCKCIYEYPGAQFAAGIKVMTVKENRRESNVLLPALH